MSTTRLPELPKAAAYATQIKEGRVLFEPRASFNVRGHVPLFTADQLNAYGLAVWQAAIEAGAKEAEERSVSVQKSNTYRGRVNAAAMFAADQLEFLASVLRSLPLPEQGSPQ